MAEDKHMNERRDAEPRPRSVSTGVTLLYATIVVGIFRLLFTAPHLARKAEAQNLPIWLLLVIVLSALAVSLFLIHMVAARRNWARITVLVRFLITIVWIPFEIALFLRPWDTTPFLVFALDKAQTCMQAVALVFLFQKSSSEWFRLSSRSS